ncbi:helix-turn-helix transcriptional regulator [Bradyrhizobium roseum]|uniref:helix-turn-helix transcriptional regulator n=1 Tax=Bradyrhizobium roseum TaxID=3056648 RepID=UPI0026107500|nr:LuxR family transcriptional regulator [Bradyrhizobium roseus]WKA26487.1 LuxR family transcriptional regulator [Bradyrhizobium roseus]
MKLTEEAFQEFVDALETAADEEGFERVASRVIRGLGFQRFAYLRMTDDTPALLSSYPKSWTERYFDLRYQMIDPVVQRAAKEYDLFSWGGAPIIGAAKEQQRLFEEATTFGIKSGITVPIRMGFGRIAAFTFATAESIAGTNRLLLETTDVLRLIGLYFHAHVSVRLDRPLGKPRDKAALTQRERQCLSWVARGKTISDVAVLVQIRPRTVVFHLENARRKLNAGSIAQCVAEALRRGQLL